MLKQRILTAVVLLAVIGAALAVPQAWPLVLLLCVLAAGAAWEWWRLTWPVVAGQGAAPMWLAALLGAGLLWLSSAWLSAQPPDWAYQAESGAVSLLWPAAAVCWLAVLAVGLWRADTARSPASAALTLFGLLAVTAAWSALALAYLRYGSVFLLSLMALVWVADIAAYFTGRAVGGAKLAPAISPGKTWSGALGGVAGAVLWVALSAFWSGSFGERLVQAVSWPVALLCAVALAALSIGGDLFESLLKRRAGRKDSSQLLPGHGGIYDRIDALLPVAPVALWLVEGWAS